MDPRDQMGRLEEGRMFNETKLNGWLTWASFLGWGWRMKVGGIDLLIPDAHSRLKIVLSSLFPNQEEEMPIAQFADNLADTCPDLDGGILFEQCWQASRGTEIRGNQISLMLSTGLRSLHDNGQIELIHHVDSRGVWQLYPAQGHPLHRITHVRLKA